MVLLPTGMPKMQFEAVMVMILTVTSCELSCLALLVAAGAVTVADVGKVVLVVDVVAGVVDPSFREVMVSVFWLKTYLPRAAGKI